MTTRPLAPWTVLTSEPVFAALPWFEVARETVALPDGRVVDDFYRITAPDYVEMLVVDEGERLLGLWRYKHGPGRVNLGLPGGYIGAGEEPLAAAQRELAEECGLAAERWERLGTYVVDGNRGCGHAHVFVARGCREVAERPPSDDLEECEMQWLDLGGWRRALAAGEVASLGAAVAVLWALVRAGEAGR